MDKLRLGGIAMWYPLKQDIDKGKLKLLLDRFRSEVRRDIDRGLADEIERQMLDSDSPAITRSTMKKLARWCKTDGHLYQDGLPIAQQISLLLFGTVLDRTLLNT
jgi:hypothetical protein